MRRSKGEFELILVDETAATRLAPSLQYGHTGSASVLMRGHTSSNGESGCHRTGVEVRSGGVSIGSSGGCFCVQRWYQMAISCCTSAAWGQANPRATSCSTSQGIQFVVFQLRTRKFTELFKIQRLPPPPNDDDQVSHNATF